MSKLSNPGCQWGRCRSGRSLLLPAVIACAMMPGDLRACNVPAFRYALERWPADPYQILVYHQAGPQSAAFALLQESASKRRGGANCSLKTVDLASPEGKSLAGQRGIVAYPWVEVCYPVHSPLRTPVWSGPLTLDRARKILNSPARSRLALALLSGEVAVWILVKSGDTEKDRRARDSLQTSLDRAAATLRIPDIGTDAAGNPIEVTDFKDYPVRFGLIEVDRGDPEEELLVSALRKSEPDLGAYDEPMAFPVFGRGRALYALVGSGIQEKTIRQACQSMLAWCSCEIKAQNPGTDLLIAADWSRPFGGRMVKEPELPLTGLGNFLPAQKPAQTAQPRPAPEPATPAAVHQPAPAPAPSPAASPLVRNLLYLAGAAAALLLAVSVLLAVKAKR